MTKPAALLCLCRSHVVKEAADSVQDFLTADLFGPRAVELRAMSLKFPPYPARGRNKLTADALRMWPELAAVVWLDDDTGFQPVQLWALLDLVDDAHPIVSGLYFTPEQNGDLKPVLLKTHASGVGLDTITDWPRDTLLPVASVGMGFCAISARMLREHAAAHGPTWFDHGVNERGAPELEDSSFCRRMRAAGHGCFVHTGIVVDHWKTVALNQRSYDAQVALRREESRPKENE